MVLNNCGILFSSRLAKKELLYLHMFVSCVVAEIGEKIKCLQIGKNIKAP